MALYKLLLFCVISSSVATPEAAVQLMTSVRNQILSGSSTSSASYTTHRLAQGRPVYAPSARITDTHPVNTRSVHYTKLVSPGFSSFPLAFLLFPWIFFFSLGFSSFPLDFLLFPWLFFFSLGFSSFPLAFLLFPWLFFWLSSFPLAFPVILGCRYD